MPKIANKKKKYDKKPLTEAAVKAFKSKDK